MRLNNTRTEHGSHKSVVKARFIGHFYTNLTTTINVCALNTAVGERRVKKKETRAMCIKNTRYVIFVVLKITPAV